MLKGSKTLLNVSLIAGIMSAYAVSGYAEGTKTGVVNGSNVNVRSQPSATSSVLTKVNKGTSINISGESNGWYNISLGSVTGWMSSQFVTVAAPPAVKPSEPTASAADNSTAQAPVQTAQQPAAEAAAQPTETTTPVSITATITGDDVNLRSSASLTAAVLTRLKRSEKVKVLENTAEWSKVQTSGQVVGWVSKRFVSIDGASASRGGEEETFKTGTTEAAEGTSKGNEMVEFAKQLLGVQYVYGGSSPKGFDCSGFTSYVYKNFDISINRVAADQAKQGRYVEKSELKSGDLVFFDTDGGKNYINHVGIYIGGGDFIHASSGRNSKRVVVSNLSSGFYLDAYMTARRFLE